MQGNILEERRLAGTVSPPGDQDTLVESWTYLPGFGGPLQQEFSTSYTAPDGTTIPSAPISRTRLTCAVSFSATRTSGAQSLPAVAAIIAWQEP